MHSGQRKTEPLRTNQPQLYAPGHHLPPRPLSRSAKWAERGCADSISPPRIPQIIRLSNNLPSLGLASTIRWRCAKFSHGHANTTLLAGMHHPNLAGTAGILPSYQTRQVAAAAGAPQHMCHVLHHVLRRPHPQHSPSTRAGPDRPPCNLNTSSVDVHTSSGSSSAELSRAQSSSSSTAPELRPDALEIDASSGGSAHLGLGLGSRFGLGMGLGFGLGSGLGSGVGLGLGSGLGGGSAHTRFLGSVCTAWLGSGLGLGSGFGFGFGFGFGLGLGLGLGFGLGLALHLGVARSGRDGSPG